MCRLVAYAGEPVPLHSLMFGGSHPLYEQSWAPRELLDGTVNADGYGVGWYVRGQAVRTRRVGPVWHDPDLEDLLASVRATPAVALLRNATPGIPADLTGVAPLLHEGWLFGLNGFIQDFRRRAMRRVHQMIPEDLYGELKGVSDTEALFFLALDRLRGGATRGEALTEVVALALELCDELGVEAQLNLLLADSQGVALTRAGNLPDANSVYFAEEPDLAPGGTLLASEPLDEDPRWQALPTHSLIDLDAGGGVRLSNLGG